MKNTSVADTETVSDSDAVPADEALLENAAAEETEGFFDYSFCGYDIENLEGDKYSAANWEENISIMITFSDGGMDLSGEREKLEEYNGHYTLRPDGLQ